MLTAKQEKFCLNIIKGMNQAAAYRDAYDTKKMKDKTVWENASRLINNSKVTARLEELRKKTTAELKYTVEDSFKKLGELQELAVTAGNINAALKAEELKGKLKGLYIEKKEISGGLDTSPFRIEVVE